MRRLIVAWALALLTFAASATSGSAQTGGADQWVLIGKLRLDRLLTREALEVDTVQSYKGVRLVLQGGDVRISRVQVAWTGGVIHTEDRSINLLDGERTRPIDQTDRARRISRIGVLYQAAATGQPLVLEAWGLAAPPLQGAGRAAPKASDTLVGAAEIDLGADRSEIAVSAGTRKVANLRIQVLDNNVFIDRLRVVYATGDPDDHVVATEMRPGSRTRWLFVNADRPISSVQLAYRGRSGLIAGARVEVHGRADVPGEPVPPNAARGVAPEGTPTARSPVGETKSASAGAAVTDNRTPACIAQALCTPVPIFFGTNRQRQDDGGNIQFTKDRGVDRLLGQATVTVPRAYRKPGEIPRPAWSDLLRFANPYREDPTRHFTVLASATKIYANEAEFMDAVKAAIKGAANFKDHAFIFVHGFNVSFDHALYRTAQIAYDLGQDDLPFGTAFLYSWPSAGEIESYIYDLESAQKAVPHLESFIELVASQSGAKHVHLIAHSMGNAPLLAALDAIARKDKSRTIVDQVILASPDVDAKDFAEMSARILPLAQTLTLYASSYDRALLASRKARRDLKRAGDVVGGLPVIVAGLDTVDASSVSTAIFDLNHSVYADKKELLNDMRRLMLTNQRPPNIRDISIKAITDKGGTFWRFVN